MEAGHGPPEQGDDQIQTGRAAKADEVAPLQTADRPAQQWLGEDRRVAEPEVLHPRRPVAHGVVPQPLPSLGLPGLQPMMHDSRLGKLKDRVAGAEDTIEDVKVLAGSQG
jgi:hypothetical protein